MPLPGPRLPASPLSRSPGPASSFPEIQDPPGPLALASPGGSGGPAGDLALVPGLCAAEGQAQGPHARPRHHGPAELQQHEVMLVCAPRQDGARALLVLGVEDRTRGPAQLFALQQQQVVIPDSSPQGPGEGRAFIGTGAEPRVPGKEGTGIGVGVDSRVLAGEGAGAGTRGSEGGGAGGLDSWV